jgi:hypothetical protein
VIVEQRVRYAIYQQTAATGQVPGFQAVASACGLDSEDVSAACRALAEAHVLILRSDASALWAAPPFSAVPTPFRVHAGGRVYYAPCAWDAFGIPAALKTDASIDAWCPASGQKLAVGVSDRAAYGDGIIHLEVPARHFWDDIVYT